MKCGRLSIIAGLIAASIFLTAAAEERVTIMEWDAPTPKSFPHDPAVGPDGALWYTGLLSEKLGRLDPRTGIIIEYPLKTADPGLHGLTADKEGRIWFTAGYQGYIGMLDPGMSGRVDEWLSPGGPGSKPFAIAATTDGMIWYSESGMRTNTIVRFDPVTKDFLKWPVRSGGGVIRNMAAAPGGDIYIACSGVNKVGVVRTGR